MNALTLCLLDAGVPMHTLVSAVSCVIDKDGELLLDPTSLEIKVKHLKEHVIDCVGFIELPLFCIQW